MNEQNTTPNGREYALHSVDATILPPPVIISPLAICLSLAVFNVKPFIDLRTTDLQATLSRKMIRSVQIKKKKKNLLPVPSRMKIAFLE